MAGFPAPPAGRDHFSELLYLIKNTEYENSQQLQSIEQEREKIARLRTELEDKLRDSEQRERAGSAAEEQSEAKEKKFTYLKENCNSLKHTALVLEEHQAALRKKLQLKQEEYQAKRDHHNGLLSKYKATWECYEAKYQTRPLAMEVSQKRKTVEDARRKVQDQSDEIACLERQIASLQLANGQEPPAEVAQWKSPAHIVTEIAKLFVERDVACGQIEQKMSLLDQLTADISALEEKVEKQQRQKEKDKTTQQEGVGHPPGTAPSAPSEPPATDSCTLSTAVGDSRLGSAPVPPHVPPQTLLCAPVLQKPPQRQAPSFLPLGQRACPSVPARAPARPASQFTVQLPSLINPVQAQRQNTALPSTGRGHPFAPDATPARPQQLPKPPAANQPPQRLAVSNFQLVTPPIPRARPPSRRVRVTPPQQLAYPVPTPVVQPASPSPQLEVSVFKCPKPVTRAPPHGTEAPTGTPGTMATKQVDLISAQQTRRERELQAEMSVREQPPAPAGCPSEVGVVNIDSEAPVNTVQQVEALGTAPPQPQLEESGEQESFMDFAATTQEQHEGTEGGMSSSPFSFGLSPQPQQQLASGPQPVAELGFALCPSSSAGLPETAGEEGSAMAFLFGEVGGEGGTGLFDGTSSTQEPGPPADSAPSWSLFGGDEGGTPSSESFSFAFGGSPQTPRSEDSSSMSMFQF